MEKSLTYLFGDAYTLILTPTVELLTLYRCVTNKNTITMTYENM